MQSFQTFNSLSMELVHNSHLETDWWEPDRGMSSVDFFPAETEPDSEANKHVKLVDGYFEVVRATVKQEGKCVRIILHAWKSYSHCIHACASGSHPSGDLQSYPWGGVCPHLPHSNKEFRRIGAFGRIDHQQCEVWICWRQSPECCIFLVHPAAGQWGYFTELEEDISWR